MCRQAQAVGAKINLTDVRARPRKAVIAVVRSVLDLMAKRVGYDTIGMGLWQGPKHAIRDIVSIALNINILKITNKLHSPWASLATNSQTLRINYDTSGTTRDIAVLSCHR